MSNILSPQEDRQVPDKKLYVAANSAITVPLWKRHIFVVGASNPRTTITLPNVGEASGREFVFVASTVPAAGGIHFDYSNGGAASLSTAVETAAVRLSFYSTGVHWKLVRT